MKTQRVTLLSLLFMPMLVAALLFSNATPASAEEPVTDQGRAPVIDQGRAPVTDQGRSGGNTATIQNPLKVNSIAEFISALLKAVIAIGVPIAILFIVLAGFKFIAAQGSPEKLAEARSNFVYVVIGIAIFIGASALAELVMATLRQIGVNV